jgi:hypothetical protein
MAYTSGFFSPGDGKTVRLGSLELTFMNPASIQGDYSVCVRTVLPGLGLAFTGILMTSGTSSSKVSGIAKSATRLVSSAPERPCSLRAARSMGSIFLALASGVKSSSPHQPERSRRS